MAFRYILLPECHFYFMSCDENGMYEMNKTVIYVKDIQ